LAIAFLSMNCIGQTMLQKRIQLLASSDDSTLQGLLITFSSIIAMLISGIAINWPKWTSLSIWFLVLFVSAICVITALAIIAGRFRWNEVKPADITREDVSHEVYNPIRMRFRFQAYGWLGEIIFQIFFFPNTLCFSGF
jgi:hypothetical protein